MNMIRSAYQVAEMHNQDIDSVTEIGGTSANNKDYTLCVFGLGEDAHFAWVGEDGKQVGDPFHSVDEMTMHVFEASVSTKH